jgi:hypothetical protein
MEKFSVENLDAHRTAQDDNDLNGKQMCQYASGEAVMYYQNTHGIHDLCPRVSYLVSLDVNSECDLLQSDGTALVPVTTAVVNESCFCYGFTEGSFVWRKLPNTVSGNDRQRWYSHIVVPCVIEGDERVILDWNIGQFKNAHEFMLVDPAEALYEQAKTLAQKVDDVIYKGISDDDTRVNAIVNVGRGSVEIDEYNRAAKAAAGEKK